MVAEEELIPLVEAEIVVWPVASAVARPFEPGAELMVAADMLEELQVTAVVMFAVLLSE
jgi:hypothetical protein